MEFKFVFGTYAEASEFIAELVVELAKRKPKVTLGTATGSTFGDTYKFLAKKSNLIQDNIKFIRQMDNYYSGPEALPENGELPPYSYEKEIREAVCRFFPKADFDIPQEFAKDIGIEESRYAYFRQLASEQSDLWIQLMGVGRDGHIASIEPGSSILSTTHLIELDDATIQDNAKFFGGDTTKVPHRAITCGIIDLITQSHIIILAAFGKNKKQISRKALYGEVSDKVPVSLIRVFPGARVLVFDKESDPGIPKSELCKLSAAELADFIL